MNAATGSLFKQRNDNNDDIFLFSFRIYDDVDTCYASSKQFKQVQRTFVIMTIFVP